MSTAQTAQLKVSWYPLDGSTFDCWDLQVVSIAEDMSDWPNSPG